MPQILPHTYTVSVTAGQIGTVHITSPGLDALPSEPPAQFNGSGKLWSPETLLVASVADCLVLAFRLIANTSQLQWTTLVCDATGTVSKEEGVTQFTEVHLNARLVLPAQTDRARARRALEKAKGACLVSNSLKCETSVSLEIV